MIQMHNDPCYSSCNTVKQETRDCDAQSGKVNVKSKVSIRMKWEGLVLHEDSAKMSGISNQAVGRSDDNLPLWKLQIWWDSRITVMTPTLCLMLEGTDNSTFSRTQKWQHCLSTISKDALGNICGCNPVILQQSSSFLASCLSLLIIDVKKKLSHCFRSKTMKSHNMLSMIYYLQGFIWVIRCYIDICNMIVVSILKCMRTIEGTIDLMQPVWFDCWDKVSAW